MIQALFILVSSIMISMPFTAAGSNQASPQQERGAGFSGAGAIAHEEIIDGVKATFKVLNMKESMLVHGVEMPRGIKETHHLAVVFRNAKSGRLLTEGQVRAKIIGPDHREQIKDLAEMKGHFGVDVDLLKKGKYGIMVKFKIDDEMVRETRFWYTVK
ncbi:MAG TPA: hypothetical protein VL197_11405 [Nitrospirota bacterium]|nr:hypothetical protein [Nitrospirota bacterium]